MTIYKVTLYDREHVEKPMVFLIDADVSPSNEMVAMKLGFKLEERDFITVERPIVYKFRS